MTTSIPSSPTVHTLVIGAGSWGTALAATSCQNGPTLLLARSKESAQEINLTHQNSTYLSGISLPDSLLSTTDTNEALQFLQQAQSLIILAVPVRAMRTVCNQWFSLLTQHNLTHIPIIWTCKGFEEHSGLLPHEIVQQVVAEHNPQATETFKYGVLSGPSFAQEVAQHLPVALTVGSNEQIVNHLTMTALHNQYCRIYGNHDLIGIEVGGALKNIIAVACGICDGLHFGNNARAAIITRGLAEISRFGVALGGKAETFAGLTGLGDLVLTATGDLSRNRRVGLAIGQGQKLAQILSTGLTAEGVRCAQAVLERSKQLQVEMPITAAVCQVLFNDMPATTAVSQLLARVAKNE